MAEKKKPKPGPSTGGSSTSRIKRPKGSQPLTLGTGGLRTGKVSKKQQAGTRKVVGAIASVTPIGKAAGVAGRTAGAVANKAVIGRRTSKVIKESSKNLRLAGKGAPKQPSYPSNLINVKNKPSKTIGLETRGKRRTRENISSKAMDYMWDKKTTTGDYGVDYIKDFRPGSKNNKLINKALKVTRGNNKRVKITGTPKFSRGVSEAREGLAKLHGVKTKDMKMAKAIGKANKRALKSVNKKK
jgi:hypothetical protein